MALAAAVALIAVWGANFSIQKHLLNLLSPSGFLWLRYLIMPLCALVMMRWTYGRFFPPLPRKDIIALAGLGFIGHSVHVGLVTFGIHWSTPFSSSVILACGPLFTLFILRWQGHERLHKGQVLGVSVAFVGVLLFLSEKLINDDLRATGGDLVLLLSSFLFSYYTVSVKPLIEKHGSILTMGYATLLGGLPLMLACMPTGVQVDWLALGWQEWALLFWSVLISAFAGWWVWGWLNAVRGVARTAPMMYLIPPVAGLFAWVLTGEQFSGVKLLGAGVALVGVAWAQFARASQRNKPS